MTGVGEVNRVRFWWGPDIDLQVEVWVPMVREPVFCPVKLMDTVNLSAFVARHILQAMAVRPVCLPKYRLRLVFSHLLFRIPAFAGMAGEEQEWHSGAFFNPQCFLSKRASALPARWIRVLLVVSGYKYHHFHGNVALHFRG